MSREITVDADLCMGSGQCCLYASATFGQDERTIAIVLDPYGDPVEAIERAIKYCPTQAISMTDESV